MTTPTPRDLIGHKKDAMAATVALLGELTDLNRASRQFVTAEICNGLMRQLGNMLAMAIGTDDMRALVGAESREVHGWVEDRASGEPAVWEEVLDYLRAR